MFDMVNKKSQISWYLQDEYVSKIYKYMTKD